MIREEHDEAVLALSDAELELLSTILNVVAREQVDIHQEDQWFDTPEDLHFFRTLTEKVEAEKE